MKKVLYITNIETPYRNRFLNCLAEKCALTVLYERERSNNRDHAWSQSVNRAYRTKFLKGINYKSENRLSLLILKEILFGYDAVIFGCCNSPSQVLAILLMRLFRKKFIINLDGEQFLEQRDWRKKLKGFVLRDADTYLAAGEKSAETMRKIVGDRLIIPYYFSSLTRQELIDNASVADSCNRGDTVLVVGQYFDYKGMDVALEAARLDQSIRYKFVGMGSRTELMQKEHQIPENVELIPFLQKKELEKEYQSCGMLVLPSRQECWGLVINEAASFGMPIVSTWGSGAAVEFLGDGWSQYLAKPGDPEDLFHRIQILKSANNKEEYSQYLLRKSRDYYIERSVQSHLTAL